MKIDVRFMEFYIRMMHNKSLRQYFGVSSQICSAWKRRGKVSDNKILDFMAREGTIDVQSLFNRIYPS